MSFDEVAEAYEAGTLTETTNPFRLADVPYRSYSDFGETHSVFFELLPFEYRRGNPLEELHTLREYLDGRPMTSKQVTTHSISQHVDVDTLGTVFNNFEDVMLLFGWWNGGENHRGNYYCNPRYCHGFGADAITDPEERVKLFHRAADLGLPLHELTPMFGLSTDRSDREMSMAVYEIVAWNDVTWTPRRQRGVEKMARTWKTMNHWGYFHREIGAAFGRPRRTVTQWINRDAEGFEPPNDPTAGFVHPSHETETGIETEAEDSDQ